MKPIGEGRDRVDGKKKVTGGARYAADTPVEKVAHAVIVESTVASGKIASLDTAAASAATGVLAVISHLNAPRLPAQPTLDSRATGTDRILALLQDPTVRYDRQPIAVVVAGTLDQALHAASLVRATYSGNGAVVVDVAAAAAEDPHDPKEKPKKRGDPEGALAAAPVKIEATYRTPFEAHNPMETHATVAVWQGDKALTVYESTQGVFESRRKLAASLGLPKESVRVISPYVGGGFGCKGSVWSNTILAALAAKVVKRPVKLTLTRPQMFGLTGFRPQTQQRIAIGAQKDGTLSAIRFDAVSSTSRFDEFLERVGPVVRETYRCPNVSTRLRVGKLDTGTPAQMRAPGEVTGNFALECALDELAVELKMDPLALRRKNHADVDPDNGKPWSSKSLLACYERAADKFGWSKRSAAPRSMRKGHHLVGWGMATATYPAHVQESSATARYLADGTAVVLAGTQDIGTGTYTVMTQIAADALGVPIEKVFFDLGDTDLPESPTSGGSTTAVTVGSAVRVACLALRKKLVELAIADKASPVSGAKDTDVVITEGKLEHRAHPGKGEPLEQLLKRAKLDKLEEKIEKKKKKDDKGGGKPEEKPFSARSFGAQFVEVEVDEMLGMVRVSRAVAAFAAGRILNEKTARSQYLGGMIGGIGMALEERMRFDVRRGRVINADLSEYHVPVNADVPALDVIMVPEEDALLNEIGAKGIGEIGITGIAAAIANAVFHATGKRIRELPITLEKLL